MKFPAEIVAINLAQGFFQAPATEKTRTQAENSSQKLKEKK